MYAIFRAQGLYNPKGVIFEGFNERILGILRSFKEEKYGFSDFTIDEEVDD